MRIIILFLLGIIITTTTQCVMSNQFSAVAPGIWRGTLMLDGKRSTRLKTKKEDMVKRKDKVVYEEVTEGELPFNFEVIYDTDSVFHLEIINGEERIILDDIIYGHNWKTGADTIVIEIPHYDSRIKARFEPNVIEGEFIMDTRKYSIPFVATHGKNYRFTQLRKTPVMNISGKWEVTFGLDEDKEEFKGVGEFVQNGNHLTGTFRTETGDYRYLEGTIQDNKIYLSTFDGSHAFLFEAKILEDGTMTGSFRSGSHYRTIWEATKNEDFELTRPDDLTYLKEGYDKVSFTFPDLAGNPVSLEDYEGKYKIIQIMGTWCPNCADETAFLSDYYNNLNRDDLAIVALAYEKQKDPSKAKAAVQKWIDRFEVKYDVLLANTSEDKAAASATLPMLNEIISYPTMIFIDKNDKVQRIHTGFEGPATSKYEGFVKDFERFMEEFLES